MADKPLDLDELERLLHFGKIGCFCPFEPCDHTRLLDGVPELIRLARIGQTVEYEQKDAENFAIFGTTGDTDWHEDD